MEFDMVAKNKSIAKPSQTYISRIPKMVKKGHFHLCHNYIRHEIETQPNENGFRAWWTNELPDGFVVCHCGWSGLPHFRSSGQTKKDFSVTLTFNEDKVKVLLYAAFESGSVDHWCRIEGYRFPPGITEKDFEEGGKCYEDSWGGPAYLIPLQDNCSVVLRSCLYEEEEEGGEEFERTFILDLRSIRRGLKVMAKKYPGYFIDALTDNGDMNTGDVFLQCCLVGKVDYS
jgi:hypothetical protein